MVQKETNQIADAILELAESINNLASQFQTDVGYYKSIADIFEEMNYYQNKEKKEVEKK